MIRIIVTVRDTLLLITVLP